MATPPRPVAGGNTARQLPQHCCMRTRAQHVGEGTGTCHEEHSPGGHHRGPLVGIQGAGAGGARDFVVGHCVSGCKVEAGPKEEASAHTASGASGEGGRKQVTKRSTQARPGMRVQAASVYAV